MTNGSPPSHDASKPLDRHVRSLPWPEHREVAERHDVEAEAFVDRSEMLAGGLRDPVRADRCDGPSRADRVPVDRRARCEDDPPDPDPEGRVENPLGDTDVQPARRREAYAPRVLDAGPSRQVIHDIGTGEQLVELDRLQIDDVLGEAPVGAGHGQVPHLDLGPVPPVVVVDPHDLGAVGEQPIDEGRADEAGRSGQTTARVGVGSLDDEASPSSSSSLFSTTART